MAGPTYQLVMHSGPNQGKVAPLEKNEIFIGRDLANDIVINDAEVSRRHSRLVLQAGGYVLEDLGSTNGTSVNNQKLVGPYILKVGDVITLGEHVTIGFEQTNFDPDATIASAAAFPQVGPSVPPSAPPAAYRPPAYNPPPAQPPVAPPPPYNPPPAYNPPPMQAVPPPPEYVGQVPQGPGMGNPAVYGGSYNQTPDLIAEPQTNRNRRNLFVALGVLAGICLCVLVPLAIIDTLNLWCTLFPFLAGC